VTSLEGLRQRVERELFHDPLAEMHDLRRQVREHREQAATLFRERAALKAHVENLERERARVPAEPERKRGLLGQLRTAFGLG
jgi:cell division protein FtsB